MLYKEAYLKALRQQHLSRPSYPQGLLTLERLTVADALQINLKFIACYSGELSRDDFIKQCVLLVALRDEDKRLFDLNDLTTDDIAAQIQKSKPDQFGSFWAVAVEYFLFMQIMTTPPVEPNKVTFCDYSDSEQLQSIKNSYLAIDAIVRSYQAENKITFDMPLIDLAVIFGALTINGGVLLADRIAIALKSRLELIAYLTEVNNIYTSAVNAKHPNQTLQSGFTRLKRSGYFKQSPFNALLAVHSKQIAEAINYAKQQVKSMMTLKQQNEASYNEKLLAATDKTIQNLESLLDGKAELKHFFVIKADREAIGRRYGSSRPRYNNDDNCHR